MLVFGGDVPTIFIFDEGRRLRQSADEELMKYAFEDVDWRVSSSWSWL